MKNKEQVFKLLDKTRINLFYGFVMLIILFFAPKLFNFSNYALDLLTLIVLSSLFVSTGLIYLCEGVYIRKLLVVGSGGAYDYYYKKAAVIQGIILFLMLLNLTMLIWFHNELFAIFVSCALALSILFHIIMGHGK